MPEQASCRLQYLQHLLRDNGAVELRHRTDDVCRTEWYSDAEMLEDDEWRTGWYSDIERLDDDIFAMESRGDLYTSLNRPKVGPIANSMHGAPIRNDSVAWITRIPFDLDPVRPAGVCSTDEELAEAGSRAEALAGMLRKSGWPMPLKGMSGNGYHLQYRCSLPNNDETQEMMRVIYYGLHAEYSDDIVTFDRTVRNPGRIMRLYGTVNRKGPATDQRPHRLSWCRIPQPWRQASPHLVEQLARRYEESVNRSRAVSRATQRGANFTGNGDYRTLDIVALMASHGLYRRPVGDGIHAVWCPWRDGHSTPHGATGAVVFENSAGQWPGFHCHHSSCAGRSIVDVLSRLADADQFCEREYKQGAK